MSYYRLKMVDQGENIMLRMVSHAGILHTSGTQIKPDAPDFELPFRFEMDIGEYGYDQFDPFFEGEVEDPPLEERLVDYYSNVCVMSPRLVEVLQAAGVDNIQTFPTHITNTETGDRLERDYVFVNIVGMVSCADIAKSDTSPIGTSHYFHDLVIDESRTQGLLLFRLAESPFEVIVHENVATAIEGGNFKGLGLEQLGTSQTS